MKIRAIAFVCVLSTLFATTGFCADQQPEEKKPSTVVKAVDAVIVRPISFCSMVAGSAVFVLALPVTAITKETKPAADALVVKPACKTFKRPLGDMDAMAD